MEKVLMQSRNVSNKKILVVDDEVVMLTLLERVLEEEGYGVLLASNGEQGFKLVQEEQPALILLDIMMPGPDGYTTLEKIREISTAPVIMLTAVRDSESIQRAIDSGADDFIKKPFRPAELVARIEAKLKRA